MSTPGSLMSIEPWKLGNSQSYEKQTESHNNISDNNNNNNNNMLFMIVISSVFR